MAATLICQKDIHLLPDPDAVILFHHIPKTAGSTVGKALARAFAPHEYITGMPQISQYIFTGRPTAPLCLMAHYIHNIHLTLPDHIRAFYFTFLRRPLDRMLSEYNYHIGTMYKQPEELPLEKYIFHDYGNLYVRLFGYGDYEKAREVLFSEYSFYGITEHFEESMQRLRPLMPHVLHGEYSNHNVAPSYSHEVNEDILRLFNDKNAEDLALYEEALHRFAPAARPQARARAFVPAFFAEHEDLAYAFAKKDHAAAHALLLAQTTPPDYKFSVLQNHAMHEEGHALLNTHPEQGFILLAQRLQSYATLGKHECVEALGIPFMAEYSTRDPQAQIYLPSTTLATTIDYLCIAHMALRPDSPMPAQYERWLSQYAPFSPLPLLAHCAQNAANLRWFLSCCPVESWRFSLDRAEAHVFLGNCLLHEHRYQEGRELALRALDEAPWSANALSLLINTEDQLGEWEHSPTQLQRFRPFWHLLPFLDLAMTGYAAWLADHNGTEETAQEHLPWATVARLLPEVRSRREYWAEARARRRALAAEHIAVWGIGGRYRDVLRPQLHRYGRTVRYFIDSHAAPGQTLDGIPVYTPEEAACHPVDAVLVPSIFRQEIEARARRAGVTLTAFF